MLYVYVLQQAEKPHYMHQHCLSADLEVWHTRVCVLLMLGKIILLACMHGTDEDEDFVLGYMFNGTQHIDICLHLYQ